MGNMTLASIDNTKVFTIRYDAEVTNLKYNYAESVQATLGSATPYIRRNGIQNYRTFTIAGIISAQADQIIDGVVKIAYETFGNGTIFTVFENNIETNIAQAEKDYKDAVITFLHNGEAKNFTSDHTGPIKVRLTNIALTPKKELGGTLYSFSAQATEVA